MRFEEQLANCFWRVIVTDLVSVGLGRFLVMEILHVVIQILYHVRSSSDSVRSCMFGFALPAHTIYVEMVALALVNLGRRIPAKLP